MPYGALCIPRVFMADSLIIIIIIYINTSSSSYLASYARNNIEKESVDAITWNRI